MQTGCGSACQFCRADRLPRASPGLVPPNHDRADQGKPDARRKPVAKGRRDNKRLACATVFFARASSGRSALVVDGSSPQGSDTVDLKDDAHGVDVRKLRPWLFAAREKGNGLSLVSHDRSGFGSLKQ